LQEVLPGRPIPSFGIQRVEDVRDRNVLVQPLAEIVPWAVRHLPPLVGGLLQVHEELTADLQPRQNRARLAQTAQDGSRPGYLPYLASDVARLPRTAARSLAGPTAARRARTGRHAPPPAAHGAVDVDDPGRDVHCSH